MESVVGRGSEREEGAIYFSVKAFSTSMLERWEKLKRAQRERSHETRTEDSDSRIAPSLPMLCCSRRVIALPQEGK